MAGKKILIAVVLAAVIVAAGVWYYISHRDATLSPSDLNAALPEAPLGQQLLEKTQNPIKNALPTTNPFKQAETNPFIDVYKNPFGQ